MVGPTRGVGVGRGDVEAMRLLAVHFPHLEDTPTRLSRRFTARSTCFFKKAIAGQSWSFSNMHSHFVCARWPIPRESVKH